MIRRHLYYFGYCYYCGEYFFMEEGDYNYSTRENLAKRMIADGWKVEGDIHSRNSRPVCPSCQQKAEDERVFIPDEPGRKLYRGIIPEPLYSVKCNICGRTRRNDYGNEQFESPRCAAINSEDEGWYPIIFAPDSEWGSLSRLGIIHICPDCCEKYAPGTGAIPKKILEKMIPQSADTMGIACAAPRKP